MLLNTLQSTAQLVVLEMPFDSSVLMLYMYGYTKILEVNLFAFAYRLFHEDGALLIEEKSS